MTDRTVTDRKVVLHREGPGLWTAEDGRFVLIGSRGYKLNDTRPTNGDTVTTVGFPVTLADARVRIASVLDREAARAEGSS